MRRLGDCSQYLFIFLWRETCANQDAFSCAFWEFWPAHFCFHLDADTKLIPSFIVGKRDLYHARAFMEDLAGRLSRRVQLSSDALASYPEAVESGFGSEMDYGQLVKTYAVTALGSAAAAVRYSPAEVVKTERTVINGLPDVRRITTSHVEKQNQTLRMHCRAKSLKTLRLRWR